MAEHRIETRILLRYATYNQWMSSNTVLKVGEAAVCAFPTAHSIEDTNITPENTPPAIGIKIGDGSHPFRALPWVQAIAADVYNWAKTASKPRYSANEIDGLQSYIEEYAPGGSSGTSGAPRLYQLIRGTGANINKYYLQHKEDTAGSEWIIDTSHYIDVDNFETVFNWIGTEDLGYYGDLSEKIVDQTFAIVNLLNYSDTEISHEFVTSVSQNKGKIDVTRRQPTFNDISGVLGIAKGGLGTNTLPEGQVLIGNGTDPIQAINIDDEVTNSDNLITNRAVKSYVDNAVAGLAGAMHFIGEATVTITNNSNVNPRIRDYNFAQVQPGDVILYEEKEFVWNGYAWQLLGDETSYAVKGSIRDADIDADANISQSKIADLAATFATKVDIIEGKQLSSNDYTNEEKLKLSNIEENAQENIIEHFFLNNEEIPISTRNDLPPKSIDMYFNGMSQDQSEKLEGIEPGAQVNTITGITLNGTLQPLDPNTKIVAITAKEFTDDYKAKLDSIESGAQVNRINSISLDGVVQNIENGVVALLSNPHTEHINKIEHITLNGNNAIIDTETKTAALTLTVKEFDDTSRAKLNSIEAGAQVNLINSILVNGETQNISNGVVSLTIDPHTDHINKIEHIFINGEERVPTTFKNEPKSINLVIDVDALDLRVLKGARYPSGNDTYTDIEITNKQLELSKVAATGDIDDLVQNTNYVIFNCGSSTTVI